MTVNKLINFQYYFDTLEYWLPCNPYSIIVMKFKVFFYFPMFKDLHRGTNNLWCITLVST